MARLGILGTMVWDRIHARDVRQAPIEEWGGISYALAGASAALAPGWELRPIVKLGRDLEEAGFRLLRTIPHLDVERGVQLVDAANNRVELRYVSEARRCEQMTGGVPPWTWPELQPVLASLDALYVNFISGFEIGLDTAKQLRASFRGPIYADLHSLFLGVDATGTRVPRPLEEWRAWLTCFDAVQVNEEELSWLATSWGDPWMFAADVVGRDVELLLVTLGERGAAFVAAPGLHSDPLLWPRDRAITMDGTGAVTSRRITRLTQAGQGDPTGCGDVWGATCFARLLAGDSLEGALGRANRAAARNLTHRGATGLYAHLLGRLEA